MTTGDVVMNSLNSDSVQPAGAAAAGDAMSHLADSEVSDAVDMPDVVRRAAAADQSLPHGSETLSQSSAATLHVHTAAAQCQLTCRHHASLYISSSPSTAPTAGYQVVYASRENAAAARQAEALPDVVTVHRPAAAAAAAAPPYNDRQQHHPATSASCYCNAGSASINHCLPPVAPASATTRTTQRLDRHGTVYNTAFTLVSSNPVPSSLKLISLV